MAKVALFPVLLVVACLIAGLYGAVHDQVSYCVAPDYYHAFKFNQFNISGSLHNRLGVAVVGWLASWWMGLLIGLPVLLIGLILPDARAYLVHALVAFAVVAVTALAVGLGALLWAACTLHESNLPAYDFPPGVADKVAFARAGAMHNFSYLGGFLGIVTASAYLVLMRVRLGKSRNRKA
jgi:hypothetical protein